MENTTDKHPHFTDIQKYCYERNMDCFCCTYSQYNKPFKCKVKKSIINYILKNGVPKNLKTKKVVENE